MKSTIVLFSLLLLTSLSFSQESKYCKKITTKTDKFTGNTSHQSPYGGKIWLLKSGNTLFLNLFANGSTLNVGEKGVIIILESGEKIVRPKQEIKTDTATTGWSYHAGIVLTPEEVEKLKASPITDFRLYIYDESLSKKEKIIYQELIKCIDSK